MHVILLQWGRITIHSYGTIVALAILLGIGVATYFAKQEGKYADHISSLAIYAIVGAIIGARFWDVAFFEWYAYKQNPLSVFAIWNGGLSIQGGLVGGFIGGAIYTIKEKIPFWEIGDIMAPGIILGQGVGRIACLLNGDAFGTPTGGDYGLVYPPGTVANATYGSQPLWPAEVWEGQWDLVVLALLLILKQRKWPTGYIFLFYNILYSLGRFGLEFLRGDSPRYVHLTAAQWTSLCVIAFSIVCMIYLKLRPARTTAAKPREDK